MKGVRRVRKFINYYLLVISLKALLFLDLLVDGEEN